MRARTRPRGSEITPILLAPWGRNASTLLMSIFASAPEIVAPLDYAHERYQMLHFMRAAQVLAGQSAAAAVSQSSLMDKRAGAPPVIELPFLAGNRADLETTLLVSLWDGYIDHLLRQGLISAHTKYYAEKGTVDLVEAFSQKRKVYCIYVKRDPRDVLASSKAFNEFRENFDFGWSQRQDVGAIIRRLVAETTYCLDVLDRLPPHAIKISIPYEELVLAPERWVDRLAGILGTPLPLRASSAIPASHRTSVDAAASVGRWRVELPEDVQEKLAASAGPLLLRLGYR
jgi:hypothetical protein